MTAATPTMLPDPTPADPRVKAVVVEIKRHRSRPDALLEVLHRVQEVYGYLPPELLWFVARRLRLPPSRVYGVATFYHFFTLRPKGRHACVTCLGTACHIKGAAAVLAAVEDAAGAKAGATSADGGISVQTARCLGACGLAPVVIYDGTVTARQTPDAARERIRGWRDGPR
jgi:bidirectional [NiFe] hydrogenase diaphorase subunit